jgi:hypothetical protein
MDRAGSAQKTEGAQNFLSEARAPGVSLALYAAFPPVFGRNRVFEAPVLARRLHHPRADTVRRLSMAKKILALSLVLGFALTAVAFASGQNEPSPAAGPGWAGPGNGQKLVLAGSVSFQNLIHPTLKAGDKVYELMVPRYLVYRSGVKEGAKVTVEGYQVIGMPRWADERDDNIDVFVTKATIDGKEYDLSLYRGRMMNGWGRGYGPGMMGGRGRGYGPGMMGGGRGYWF